MPRRPNKMQLGWPGLFFKWTTRYFIFSTPFKSSNIHSVSSNVHLLTGDTLKQSLGHRCLRSTARGSSGCVMLWRAFCWHGLGPHVPSEERRTANQYKTVLSVHLWWNIAILKEEGKEGRNLKLFQVEKTMWIRHYGLYSHHISIQFNT